MFKICTHQLRRCIMSTRFYVALLIGAVMQIVSVMPLIDYSKAVGKPLNLLEGFVYFNCDTFAAAAAFLGLLFMISDIPFTSQDETYTLMRVPRTQWTMGKVLYLFSICVIYYIVVLLIGIYFLSENAYFSTVWSQPMSWLASSNALNYATEYNVYFPYSYITSLLTPANAMALSFSLSVCYAFVMSLLVFLLNLKLPHVLAYFSAIMVHVINYRLATAYSRNYTRYSLLGNSLLMYHDIGGSYGNGLYLRLGQSFCIYGTLILLLLILLLFAIRSYDFKITVDNKS